MQRITKGSISVGKQYIRRNFCLGPPPNLNMFHRIGDAYNKINKSYGREIKKIMISLEDKYICIRLLSGLLLGWTIGSCSMVKLHKRCLDPLIVLFAIGGIGGSFAGAALFIYPPLTLTLGLISLPALIIHVV